MKFTDSFHVMAKPIGAMCNMDCTYCFYLEKENLYDNTNDWKMNNDVLETFIKQYIEAQRSSEIFFAWQGGEPTILGVDYFRRVITLQQKYCGEKIIHNSFQTNGIELNDEWCRFFNENNFLIGISIDGPEKIHDKYRLLKGNQVTFSKIMKSIELFNKYNVEFNTLTCVQKDNSYKGLEVYNFLKDIGSRFMQFIPIVERETADRESEKLKLVHHKYTGLSKVTSWSVESQQYGKFLSEIFDEWVVKDVGEYFVQIFDVCLQAWFGENPGLCVFSKTCGTALAIEHNGDLYSCDHFVYPEYMLGNILNENIRDLVDSNKQMNFGIEKNTLLPKYCRQCEYLFTCNGECPKHRFEKTPDGEDGLNYLCTGYKYFFNHIDPYMRFMVEELNNNRAPANVMNWAIDRKNS